MNPIIRLRNSLSPDVFDYQALTDCLRDYRKPRDMIGRMLSRGDIIRIRRGLYAFAEPLRRGPIVREQVANLIYGPSYVSLESALSIHNLIPERVEAITSITTGRSRVFETPFGIFTYRSLSPERYAVGVMLLPEEAPSFLAASPEKALTDKVWTDNRFSGTRRRDFGPYLFDDLRLDEEGLRNLNMERLLAINRCWKSTKIRNLVRFLHGLKKGENHE